MHSSHPGSRAVLCALLALLSLSACRRQAEPAGVISRDRFVAANVALRSLSDSATQEERDAALKKAGVTDRQLRAWVTAHSRDPEALAKAWERIAFRVDSIGGGAPASQAPRPTIAGSPIVLPRRDTAAGVRPRADTSLRARRRPPQARPKMKDLEQAQ